MSSRSTEFFSRIPTWLEGLQGSEWAARISEQDGARRCIAHLENLSRFDRDGPDAPLRIAFFGPTGAGKSKLYSSLVGSVLSTSGFRRPWTRRSVYYVHDAWRAIAPSLEGDAELHSDEAWRDVILIDTPDFDSVEEANREEAERVFLESDAFLFVTDSLKYADASTWDYLERIRRAEKPYHLVLNKVSSETVRQVFSERFRTTFGVEPENDSGGELIEIPDLQLGDDDLVPSDCAGLHALRDAAREMVGVGSDARLRRIERFRRELDRSFAEAERVRDVVSVRCETGDELIARLRELREAEVSALEHREASVDPEVTNEVYRRVLERLESIDLLRYPRKLLSMPFEGMRSLVRKWTGASDADEPVDPAAARNSAIVATEGFQSFESGVLRFVSASREALATAKGFESLATPANFAEYGFEHDELTQIYSKHHDEFREWAAREAQETASELSKENKVKFAVSQVLFNSVLLGVQIKSFGGFTLLELGLDGVLSPLVAKGVGMAISSERVTEFETRARSQHLAMLTGLFVLVEERIRTGIERSVEGLGAAREILADAVSYAADRESIVGWFEDRRSSESEPTEQA